MPSEKPSKKPIPIKIPLLPTSPFSNPASGSSSSHPIEKKSLELLAMEIELVVTCDCCGLKEDCTQFYISEVKAKFEGKWLCGLCSEAVRDEAKRSKKPLEGLEEAVNAHMSFCRKFKSNPAIHVADGMRLMLRRRSSDMSSSSSSSSNSNSSVKKYGRSASSSQVGFESSSLSLY